ncbi:MAG: hypothetical protein MK212_17990 [Saprospiraceae bacterium]|nr:hypothetical protein [Saprospiraceae bacterium]
MKFIIFILRFFCVALPIFCLGNAILFWSLDYEIFTNYILKISNKPDWKTYFQSAVFPAARYQYLPLTFGSLGILTTLVSIKLWNKLANYAQSIHQFWIKAFRFVQTQRQSANSLEKKVFYLLLFLFLTRTCYNIQTIPITYDEAWTYNHFISKGFIMSGLSPNNNHILYTILSVFTDYLPLPSTWTLRLVALVSGTVSFYIFYWMSKKIFNWRISLLMLGYFSFSPSITFFSVYARGYGLLILGNLITLWAVFRLLKGYQTRATWSVYLLGNWIGFYGCLAYVYSFIPLLFTFGTFALLSKRFQLIRQAFVYNLILLGILSILYLPLLVTNGGSFLIQAAQAPSANAVSITAASFWTYTGRLADWWLTGQSWHLYPYILGFIGLLGIITYRLRKDSKSLFIGFSVIFYLLFPALLYLYTKTWTSYRIWCFQSIYLCLGLGLCMNSLPKILVKKGFYLGLILMFSLGFLGSQWHYFTHWSRHLDHEAKKLAVFLLNEEATECYTFSNYDKPLLKYYLLHNQINLNVYMPFENSKDYRDFSKRAYQTVLWDKDEYQANQKEIQLLKQWNYQKIYENERIVLYKK